MPVWLLDQGAFALDALADHARLLWRSNDTWAWCLLFLPFLALDLVRVVVAGTVLHLRHWTGRGDRDLAAKRAFLATAPRISVIIAGFNERSTIASTIDSLLELGYPGLEIVVVDDNSDDRTYEVASAYAKRGQIILAKNSAASGRGGKPAAINMGRMLATGDYLVMMDADTSFDRDLLVHLIGPFHDAQVGVVAANVKVRNPNESYWSLMQALEYLMVIDVNKRWLDAAGGMNYIASGACAAYRRAALAACDGCDVETAEDLDNSLKARKAGWKLVFAPHAVAMTDVPAGFRQLLRQRQRWDRDLVRVAFRKHRSLLDCRRHDWRLLFELGQQLLLAVVCNFAYVVFVVAMLVIAPLTLVLVLGIMYLAFALLSLVPLSASLASSERRAEELRYWWAVPLYPFYNDVVLRWARTWANTLEILRINQEDAYLPQSAWRNSPRW